MKGRPKSPPESPANFMKTLVGGDDENPHRVQVNRIIPSNATEKTGGMAAIMAVVLQNKGKVQISAPSRKPHPASKRSVDTSNLAHRYFCAGRRADFGGRFASLAPYSVTVLYRNVTVA